MPRRTGWFGESRRHAMSAKGIKTAQKLKNLHKIKMKDSDKDGVPDVMDCAPFDKKKQHMITSIKGTDEEKARLVYELRQQLMELGYDAEVFRKGAGISLGQVRLNDERILERGYNVNQFSGRRGRYLTWDDWVEVNNAINQIFDDMKISANIKSLGGKFVIRKGDKAYTEDDWEDLAYENVGSQMRPMQRRDIYESEEEAYRKTPSGKLVKTSVKPKKKKAKNKSEFIPY